jgi:hypothetical protein
MNPAEMLVQERREPGPCCLFLLSTPKRVKRFDPLPESRQPFAEELHPVGAEVPGARDADAEKPPAIDEPKEGLGIAGGRALDIHEDVVRGAPRVVRLLH